MPFEKQIKELEKRRAHALKMGGDEKIKKQRDRGRFTARERIEKLLDPDSFLEVGMFNHSDMEWHIGICAVQVVALIFWLPGRRLK
jgi:acetyl-CoA carboxylase carboxyltransferase component